MLNNDKKISSSITSCSKKLQQFVDWGAIIKELRESFIPHINKVTESNAHLVKDVVSVAESFNSFRNKTVDYFGECRDEILKLHAVRDETIPRIGQHVAEANAQIEELKKGQNTAAAKTAATQQSTHEQLTTLQETAKALWGIYLFLSLCCFAGYWLAGMSWFDALIHTGTTVSIGGLSSHDASLGYFNDPVIEAVAITFMLLSGINFVMHFSALRNRSVRPYLGCPEARFFLFSVAFGVIVVWLTLWGHGVYETAIEAFRMAAFNVVAIATTTGYATADYGSWPAYAPWLMIFLCAFSTSSGSTGGGIKMIRLVIMAKLAQRELLRIIHPRSVQLVQLGSSSVSQSVVFAVLAYMLTYGATVMVATFLLLLSGMNDITAISAVLACINNLGPGLNEVGPSGNYAGLTNFQLWVLTITMLMGRLELLTVIVLLVPAFWRS